jgi:putative ABC transport system substrate-binding protein
MPPKYFPLILLLCLLFTGADYSHAAGKLVAAVLTSDLSRYKDAHRTFIKTLAQKGYDESTIEIITQTPNPDPISWANAIRKFNAIGADIIITYGAPVTLAALRESDVTPIVFVDVYDPVETGITRSMLAPGGNLTGISSKVPMITLIRTVMTLKQIKTMGVLYSSREVGSVVQLKEAKRIAAQLGLAVVEANIISMSGIGNALASFTSTPVDCIYVSESASGSRGLEKIIQKSNEYKIPVVSQMPGAANKGALVALEIDPTEQGQVAAEYAVKILGGKKPGQIPIATPKKIELIINMKTAKNLDIHVPFTVLSESTKIIK